MADFSISEIITAFGSRWKTDSMEIRSPETANGRAMN
jgi:hypothetical protein